jgi:hypothetical protein
MICFSERHLHSDIFGVVNASLLFVINVRNELCARVQGALDEANVVSHFNTTTLQFDYLQRLSGCSVHVK